MVSAGTGWLSCLHLGGIVETVPRTEAETEQTWNTVLSWYDLFICRLFRELPMHYISGLTVSYCTPVLGLSERTKLRLDLLFLGFPLPLRYAAHVHYQTKTALPLIEFQSTFLVLLTLYRMIMTPTKNVHDTRDWCSAPTSPRDTNFYLSANPRVDQIQTSSDVILLFTSKNIFRQPRHRFEL